ncbi:MAG: alpha-amylase [Chloroflexi bacterium]|nr:alpha-amylase [Chloroflexota bacterium]
MSALQQIIDQLRRQRRNLQTSYELPGLWIDFDSIPAQQVNPYDFYADRLEAILHADQQELPGGPPGGEWTRNAITYNLFPRLATAFDHNASGALENVNDDGWRETGTLLKSIAILPYVRSMGFNTIHLLPINAIGVHGRKGNLGSPYAIRNLYHIDENLAEPAVPDVDLLFAGFVEGAHRLGMRVVMEFVFRVAARDADWIAEHPEWFYWIEADIQDRKPGSRDTKTFGNPIWPADKIGLVYDRVNSGRRDDLVPPPNEYRVMYTHPPRPETIHKEDGRWIGALEDGRRVRVPGAFTDWPPEDIQPPWSDVTYFRFYDHPDYNYMAYNTLRMYQAQLAQPENAVQPLWDAIIGVIPYYQERFGIDGVMLDMGHALPHPLMQQIMQRSREINPDFAFWGEDFSISRENREQGYNAVMGFLIFDLHQPQRMQAFIDQLAYHRPEITFFVTPENHNTPRAASRLNALGFCHQALLYMVALPGMPFILNGFELFEVHPINTGLGFSHEAIRQHPPEKLPLFSEWAFDWTRDGNMVGAIRYAMHLRRQYSQLLTETDPATMMPGSSNNPNILVFTRVNKQQTLVFAFNMMMFDYQSGEAELYAWDSVAYGRWGFEGVTRLSERIAIHVELGGGHSMMFEAETPRRP